MGSLSEINKIKEQKIKKMSVTQLLNIWLNSFGSNFIFAE